MISNGSWVITGGESGFNHRECRIDWVREIRDECLGHTHLPIGMVVMKVFLTSSASWSGQTAANANKGSDDSSSNFRITGSNLFCHEV
jgi:protein gp37